MNIADYPRTINPAQTFEALVQWFYEVILTQKHAPGLLVGLSGTDSLVAFCAAAEALNRAGMPKRLMGVHFAPSEDFLYDHPEAEVHLWFRDEVLPWLRKRYPLANIVVNTSIDWRHDGLRWGALMDMSVVSDEKKRVIRLPEDQYWVVGTRNRTEDTLLNYSNASTAVSIQPLIHLWKSEVLQLSEYLGIPKIAITKSCETDCICGRDRLIANHIREVDTILMVKRGELSDKNLHDMPFELEVRLSKYIEAQIAKSKFKTYLPYKPEQSVVQSYLDDVLVRSFENGTINVKDFNHRKHLYIAWCYLKSFPFEVALDRYARKLIPILDAAGQSHRFNLPLTKAYFERLYEAMKHQPNDNFDELVEKSPSVLAKISA